MADWFKFYENGLDEPRFRYAICQHAEVLSVWILILSECSRHKSGSFNWSDKDHELFGYSEKIKVSVTLINRCIDLLCKIEYIEKKAGNIKVINWQKMQSDYCQGLTKGWYGKNTRDTLASNSEVSTDRLEQEERRGDKKRIERKKEKGHSSVGTVFPDSLNNEQFKEKWKEWETYRSEIKSPLTISSVKKQLQDCERWGLGKSLEFIEIAIKRGWRGLFEVKVNGSGSKLPIDYVAQNRKNEQLRRQEMEEIESRSKLEVKNG